MIGDVIYECDGIVFDVDWSPDGNYTAIVGEDSNLVVLKKNPDDWGFTEVFRNKRTRTIRRVAWSSDGARLVTAGFDSVAVVYDVDFSKKKQFWLREGASKTRRPSSKRPGGHTTTITS